MFSSFNARALGLILSAETTIDLAAEAGFAGVDLLVRDLLDAGAHPRTLRARMDGLGLRGGAWPLPVRWRGDRETFERDLERLPRLAEAAATLGLFRTATWVMPETPLAPTDEPSRAEHHAEVVSFHLERLGAIARVLDGFGSRLGLEVIGVESFRTGQGLPFVHRLADLNPVLGAPGREAPNFGLLVDTFHLYAAGESVEAALAWGVDRVVWVHVADLPAGAVPDRRLVRDDQRGLPGDRGAIDVRGVLSVLADAGYDGPVTAEPLAICSSLAGLSAQATAHAVARALRAVWPVGWA